MLVRRSADNWLPTVFGDLFDYGFPAFTPAKQFASPAVNIKENDKEFEIEVAAPGMEKDDLSIQLENNDELLITLEKKSCKEDKERSDKYLRREFSCSTYRQAFSLPDTIETDGISAQVNNGILCITLPKKEATEEKPVSRRIEIA
ncbi:MAG: Hsp20/alpha crystallin family protein [Bacteroidaceae bacterium]|nr:Hsp20/alpha crystallin family protein [Bacteroidaceae bacterium]